MCDDVVAAARRRPPATSDDAQLLPSRYGTIQYRTIPKVGLLLCSILKRVPAVRDYHLIIFLSLVGKNLCSRPHGGRRGGMTTTTSSSLHGPPQKKPGRRRRWSVLPCFLLSLVVVALQGLMIMLWRIEFDGSVACNSKSSLFPSKTILRTNEGMTNTKKLEIETFSSITNFLGVQARAFDPWPIDRPLPCVEPESNWFLPDVQRSPAHEGFLFVKELKTGGSSAAGINLRIARNVAKREGHNFDLCKVRNDHATAQKQDYRKRDKSKSYLWTIIRDPTKRAVSQFFHFRGAYDTILTYLRHRLSCSSFLFRPSIYVYIICI